MDVEKVIKKKDLHKFIDFLRIHNVVIAPTRQGGGTSRYCQPTFAAINGLEDLAVDYESSMISPKGILFPDNQELYGFEKKPEGICLKDSAVVWEEERVLFGLHPCDVTALLRLDKVLMEGGTEDQSYRARRDRTTVIGMTCTRVKHSCFCSMVGAGPDIDAGYDLLMTDLGDRYFCRVGSDKGKSLISAEYFRDAEEEDKRARRNELDRIREELPGNLDLQTLCDRMPNAYDHHLWDEFSDRCLTCGACNMVCPTCHCFSIIDKATSDRKKGTRVLVWDSCHFERFARTSGDLHIREAKTSRFKHRLYDKFYYDVRRSGVIFCVGCGRCLDFCPGHIDIREALRKLEEVQE